MEELREKIREIANAGGDEVIGVIYEAVRDYEDEHDFDVIPDFDDYMAFSCGVRESIKVADVVLKWHGDKIICE